VELRHLGIGMPDVLDELSALVHVQGHLGGRGTGVNRQNPEFDNFDALVRKVFAVPHSEIMKREKEYKRKRKRAKQKLAKTSPASRASNAKG
jgi:hypothetical protein